MSRRFVVLLFGLRRLGQIGRVRTELGRPISVTGFRYHSLILRFLENRLLLTATFALDRLFRGNFRVIHHR